MGHFYFGVDTYQTGDFCSMPAGTDNWAFCPDSRSSRPSGSSGHYRLFPSGYKRGDFGEYDQWGIEGFNGCWDDECKELMHGDFASQFTWKVYEEMEVPHFGLGAPKWVREIVSFAPNQGQLPEAAYTTYGACMYRKPEGDQSGAYDCVKIQPEEPWKVGAIHWPALPNVPAKK